MTLFIFDEWEQRREGFRGIFDLFEVLLWSWKINFVSLCVHKRPGNVKSSGLLKNYPRLGMNWTNEQRWTANKQTEKKDKDRWSKRGGQTDQLKGLKKQHLVAKN